MPNKPEINIEDYETLDELLRAITGPKNLSAHSSKEWANIFGLALSSLYAKGRADEEGKANSYTLKQLCAAVSLGEVEIVKWLANQLPGSGWILYQLPSPAEASSDLMGALLKAIKEFSDFTAETAGSISDGHVTFEEYGRIKKEGHESIVASVTMMHLAKKALGNKAKK